MRNFRYLLAGFMLVAAQVAQATSQPATASAELSSNAVAVKQIQLDATKPQPVKVEIKRVPDFDTEILQPLKKAQDEKAKADAEAARTAALARAKANARVLAALAPITGTPAEWMAAAGIAPSDYAYVDYIVNHEASWSGVTRYNYGGSGAYGMFQALPGSKMAVAGADWATNPVTQIKWASGYAKARYGSWEGAYRFWTTHHYW